MALKGGQAAVPASATRLTTLLSLTGGDLPSGGYHAHSITVKNAAGAANACFLGGSSVTAGPTNAYVELAAGQSFTFGMNGNSSINTDEIYVIGTVAGANVVFVAIEL